MRYYWYTDINTVIPNVSCFGTPWGENPEIWRSNNDSNQLSLAAGSLSGLVRFLKITQPGSIAKYFSEFEEVLSCFMSFFVVP